MCHLVTHEVARKGCCRGTQAWLKTAGGIGDDFGYSLSVVSDGTFDLAGCFSNSCTFGPGEPGQTVLASDGGLDGFVGHYGADGALDWVRRVGSPSHVLAPNVAAAPAGGLALGLTLQSGTGGVTFAPGEGNETTLLGQGGRDNAVARYAADGSLLWARLESSPSEETYVRVAVDAWGSILVAAGFSGEMKVALGQADEMTLTSAGMFDAYVSRYAAGGALIAAWRVGSSGDDYARDVTALPDGSFLVTGSLNDSVTFGAGDPNETTLVSGGGFDIFVARPNADGGF
ncbi:MAG: hypothetical protein P1V36_15330 [Planctomycetota bacterium]|nr:hypothetical protein [Planctomycetota bacterium]